MRGWLTAMMIRSKGLPFASRPGAAGAAHLTSCLLLSTRGPCSSASTSCWSQLLVDGGWVADGPSTAMGAAAAVVAAAVASGESSSSSSAGGRRSDSRETGVGAMALGVG